MSQLGILSVVYRDTATFASPTWTEMNLVSDVSVSPSWDEADGSVRLSRVKQTAKTMLGVELTIKHRADLTDSNYAALVDAANSDTVVDLMVLNGANTANGTRGYRGEWNVFANTEDQGLGVVVFDEFKLKPAVSSHKFQKVLVTSGNPVFTDL